MSNEKLSVGSEVLFRIDPRFEPQARGKVADIAGTSVLIKTSSGNYVIRGTEELSFVD